MDPIGLILSEIVDQASELFNDDPPANTPNADGTCPKCPSRAGTYVILAVLGIAGVIAYRSRKKGCK